MMLTVFLLILFYASHSYLAANRVKQFVQKQFPAWFKFYRLGYTIFSSVFLGVIGWLFIAKHEYHFVYHTASSIPFYIAVVLVAGGLLIIGQAIIKYSITEFIGLNVLMQNKQTGKPVLIISGLNKIVRHPIYTGVLLALVGLFLMLPTWMTLMVVVVSIIYLEIGIKLEEQKLIAEFGDAYLQYKQKVRKLIPFVY